MQVGVSYIYIPEVVVSEWVIGMRQQHSIFFQELHVQAQQLVRRWWYWC